MIVKLQSEDDLWIFREETVKNFFKSKFRLKNSIKVSIATKLIFGFLIVITIISAIFMVVGVRLISDRIVSEAQEAVRHNLNAAREIYLHRLSEINDVVRFTADTCFLANALISGEICQVTDELTRVKEEAGFDILTVTDENGNVLCRTSNVSASGDNQAHDEIVKAVLSSEAPVASTTIVSAEDLGKESPYLTEQAYMKFIDTPLARVRGDRKETSGMMLKAGAPIFDAQRNLIGVVYGGDLLNNNFEIVDKVKQTVYQDLKYEGQEIGTATIFKDDVRISTNVRNEDGSRAIGTRVSEEVYNRVVVEGELWIDRAYVVNNWYIAAYEPIKDTTNKIIGILYVGVLEQKYTDIRNQTILTFMVITFTGALISMIAAYFISRRISVPINKLVSASEELAEGNLDARVEIKTNDELQYLAESFNTMAKALKRRDEELKEFATEKIMESERLALIGQLSANVAHELNNPLQGIITYSHLLLESDAREEPTKAYVEKIVGQANRSRDIIRGLLDFSRQRTPDKTPCKVDDLLKECVSLLENQALFLNIEIVKDLQEDLPMIIIDPSQIERVFVNIIINAAEAMDGEGQLLITTRYEPSKEFVEISFMDTGGGIREEDIDRIFDPFFTTKDVGHGTGLGLAISYGIIKRHKGTILVESEIGKGTTFTIELPLHSEEKVAANGRRK